MKSPFFWRNLGALLLLIANFAFSVFGIMRTPDGVPPPAGATIQQSDLTERSGGQGTPVSFRIVLRALSVVYAAASGLMLCAASIFFCEMEFSDSSRLCWKRRNDWTRIQIGMTKAQVVDALGKPDYQETWNNAERLKYKLHPLDLPEQSEVSFNIGDDQKVVAKHPMDEQLAAQRSEWWPRAGTYRCSAFKTRLSDTAMVLSFVGIIVLAIVSLIPAWPYAHWHALSLYFPAAAIVLCVTYENAQKRGWRFDLFLLYPAYAVILVVWVLRVVHVASK